MLAFGPDDEDIPDGSAALSPFEFIAIEFMYASN